MTAGRKNFVNPANTRFRPDHAYRNVIEKIEQDGVCPFCPEHLKEYHKRPIIKRGRHWLLTDNMYPYKGTKHHLLLIHKTHIEHASEISPDAWKELDQMIKFIARKRAIKGGALVMRFGESAHTGASVAHLHANIIGADRENKKREPVLFRVG